MTINNSRVGSRLTVLNSEEFRDYVYGLETFVDRTDTVRKYADSVIYQNGSPVQQRGLFLEIELYDADTLTYHTVKAGLKKGSTVIASGYEVAFEGGNKPGSKVGYVFIPLADMLDDGAFYDVNIILDVTEYYDAAKTKQKWKSFQTQGLSEARDILLIGVDGENPEISMTEPSQKKTWSQAVNISFTDRGLGLREMYYQVVNRGKEPTESGWVKSSVATVTKNLDFAGEYDIYARALDKAGNETVTCTEGYKIYYLKTELKSRKKVAWGKTLKAQGIITTDMEIEKVLIYADGLKNSVGSATDAGAVANLEYMLSRVGDRVEYKYTVEILIPEGTAVGDYNLFMEVCFMGGEKKIVTKPITVVEKLDYEIDSAKITHTDKWEENRLTYNSRVEEDKKRGADVFWSGEAFVIQSHAVFKDEDSITEDAVVRTVEIVGDKGSKGNPYVYDFGDYGESGDFENDVTDMGDGTYEFTQRAEFFSEDMIDRWGAQEPEELTFKFTYEDETELYCTVTVDNRKRFHMLHMRK